MALGRCSRFPQSVFASRHHHHRLPFMPSPSTMRWGGGVARERWEEGGQRREDSTGATGPIARHRRCRLLRAMAPPSPSFFSQSRWWYGEGGEKRDRVTLSHTRVTHVMRDSRGEMEWSATFFHGPNDPEYRENIPFWPNSTHEVLQLNTSKYRMAPVQLTKTLS